jgi:hypothetical protein
MNDSAIIIRDGEATHRLQITHRDWMLINGPGFVEGPIFITAFGIFENFTVAGGIAKGSLVNREGQKLFEASSILHAGIRRDQDFLCHDYSYKIADQPKRFGGSQSIAVDGRPAILSLRPKGYCSIRFVDGKSPELVDLRGRDGFMTDAGPIKLYRRKAEIRWLEILPPLMNFLETRLTRMLSLEHIDRMG